MHQHKPGNTASNVMSEIQFCRILCPKNNVVSDLNDGLAFLHREKGKKGSTRVRTSPTSRPTKTSKQRHKKQRFPLPGKLIQKGGDGENTHTHIHAHTQLKVPSCFPSVVRNLSYREREKWKTCDGAGLGVNSAFRQHLERPRLGQQPAASKNRHPVLLPAEQQNSSNNSSNSNDNNSNHFGGHRMRPESREVEAQHRRGQDSAGAATITAWAVAVCKHPKSALLWQPRARTPLGKHT